MGLFLSYRKEGRLATRSKLMVTKTPFEVRWLREMQIATSRVMLAAIDSTARLTQELLQVKHV